MMLATPSMHMGMGLGGSGSATAASAPPAAPRRPTKSLGVRKHHAGGGMRASQTSGAAITSFFSKRPAMARAPLADCTNGATQQQPQLSSSPSCSPPVFRALFGGVAEGGNSQCSQPSQPSQPSCTPPVPLQLSGSAPVSSSAWSDTPPDPVAVLPLSRYAGPVSGSVPAPPVKAPRKSARRDLQSACSSAAPSPLLMGAGDSEDSDCRLLPFSLNLSSQPSQEAAPLPPQPVAYMPLPAAVAAAAAAAAASSSPSAMADVDGGACSQSPTRSSSHCSDIVIQASQDAEEEEEDAGAPGCAGVVPVAPSCSAALDHDEAAVLGEGRCSDAMSNRPTPLLATPQQVSPGLQLTPPLPAATDFSAFNQAITAAASSSSAHRPSTTSTTAATAVAAGAGSLDLAAVSTSAPVPAPAAAADPQYQCPDMPPPSRSPTFTSKSQNMLRASSRAGSVSYAHAAAAQRTTSQSGLPPPVPRGQTSSTAHAPSASQSSQPTTFHQTHLNFARTNSASMTPQSLSQQERSHSGSGRFPTFAAAAAAAHSAATSVPMLSSQPASQQHLSQSGVSLSQSLDSNSLFCTPVDQPIRERTLFEMSEELMLQREGVQVQQMQQQQQQQYQQQFQQQQQAAQGRGSVAINTHVSLSALGRCGSSNSGLTPPPIKRARFNQQAAVGGPGGAGRGGLESMQILGTNLPMQPGEELLHSTQPMENLSQQMTQQQGQAQGQQCQSSYLIPVAQAPHLQAAPLTLENPFIGAVTLASAASSSSSSSSPRPSNQPQAASSARGGKKRGLGDSASSSSTLLCTLPTNSSSFLLSHFEYVRQFGIGSFGFVMLVRHRLDGTLYAVKKSKSRLRGANSTRLMTREVHVMTFLKTRPHCPDSILKIVFSWQEDAHLYIQTEYCEGGSLAALLRKGGNQDGGQKSGAESNGVCSQPAGHLPPAPSVTAVGAASDPAPVPLCAFPEDRLVEIALQMGRALAFMHHHRIVHLDVKPDNILQYAPGCYRLGDFGLACASDSGSSGLLAVGDKRYLPLEALDECIADLTKVDMFALGCSLYELACGAPFALPMSHMEMNRIRNADIDDVAPLLSPRLYDLIRQLLHPDPAQRKSAQQLVDEIEEHWHM